MRRSDFQIANLSIVAQRLKSLGVDFVFTGGSVVGLLITDRAAPDVRPTDDVDVIVDITKYSEYVSSQEELTKLGFRYDKSGPLCRFTLDELIVDIMPVSGDFLGFSNSWYQYAMDSASTHELSDDTKIRVVSAPAFIATKLEAFSGRGKLDYIGSHDIEDIIAVLDGRTELIDELKSSAQPVRSFLAKTFGELLNNKDFIDSIAGHLAPDSASQDREELIIEKIRMIASLT